MKCGSPGASADAQREAVLNTFCPIDPNDPGSQIRYVVVSTLGNGNYWHLKVFEHYEKGCCRDREDTLQKCEVYYVRACAGAVF